MYRTPVIYKDVTFDPVPLYIICVRLGPSISGVYVRARVLVPLKPGCDSSCSGPRPSGGFAGACRTQRRMRPHRTASRGWTDSRQASSRHRWATPTWVPPAHGVCSGFQVRNMDSWLALVYENDSEVWSMEKYYGEKRHACKKKEFKYNTLFKQKKLHAKLFFK